MEDDEEGGRREGRAEGAGTDAEDDVAPFAVVSVQSRVGVGKPPCSHQ
jgi:hypothetical protein